MKREKISDNREIGILAAALYNDSFLLELSKLYSPGLFSDEKIDHIIEWSITFLSKHGNAPGIHIRDILIEYYKNGMVPEKEGTLYENIVYKAEATQAKGLNLDFIREEMKTLLKEKSLEKLMDTVDDHLQRGEHSDALQAVEAFSQPVDDSSYILPFEDKDKVREAFELKASPLFTFKGALGELVNPYLTRDSFVAFMGPEKRGKSWWLFEFAIRSMFARKNVAVFQVGDMSEDQGLRRLYMRLAGKNINPVKDDMVLVPVLDCRNNQDQSCQSKVRDNKIKLLQGEGKKIVKPDWKDRPRGYKPCTLCRKQSKALFFLEATWFKQKTVKSLLDWRGSCDVLDNLSSRTKGKQFRLSTHPNNSVSVSDIDKIVKGWEKEGWTPDVIVIDYADILAPETVRKDYRHQENDKWKALRRLSQEHSCLVLTATQSDANSYGVSDLTPSNFSEDKRKFGHVTGMLALNQTPQEKKEGVMRLGWLVLREGEFSSHRQVACLQCLQLGRPYLDGFWVNRKIL